MLSYQLIHASEGGINYTWSSIAATESFRQAEMPMPILIADGRNPGEKVVGGNSTIYEFNPWEFGSFDPTVFGFAPLQYLGSTFEKGVVPPHEKCIRGYDSASFIMGTSSSLFNQFLLNLNSTDLGNTAKKMIREVLGSFDEEAFDIANYTNPFYHASTGTTLTKDPYLAIVDGGEDLQNIPLHPMIQPERKLDVVFAIDSSADTNNWPDGTSLVATYERSLEGRINNGTGFPAIPDRNTFLNLGLNNRPTFFGCDTSNLTGTQSNSPLVVYIPNSPYVINSNISTFKMSHNDTQRDALILNGYNVATMGNGTRDSEWSTCVGCAVLSRSLGRTNTSTPAACSKCFERYCWNGTTDSRVPSAYEPKLILEQVNLTSQAGLLNFSLIWCYTSILVTLWMTSL
jgi:Lysophospholipase catalytic domain.